MLIYLIPLSINPHVYPIYIYLSIHSFVDPFILQDLVPVTVYVPVPFVFHRFIIGPQGQEIRTLADKYSVSVEVPPLERQESKITLHGPAQNCDDAKQALERRVLELEAEKEERVSTWF